MATIKKYFLALFVNAVAFIFIVIHFNVISENSLTFDSKENCGRFPITSDISFENGIWQVLRTPDGGFLYMMNAYLDTRRNKSVVINLVGKDFSTPLDNLFCQFWFEDEDEPIVIEDGKA